MLALGIILLLVAAAVFFGVLAGGGGQPTVDLGAVHVATTTVAVFLTGAATVVVIVLAVWLIRTGLRTANRRRKDKKQLNRLTQGRETPEAARATTTTTGEARTGAEAGDRPITGGDQPKP